MSVPVSSWVRWSVTFLVANNANNPKFDMFKVEFGLFFTFRNRE